MKHAAARIVITAVALACALCTVNLVEAAQRPPIEDYPARASLPNRPAIALRAKSVAGTTPAYSIVDDGTPTGFELFVPVAINNTGQIAGGAYDKALKENTCAVFDGGQYREVSTLATFTNCEVNAMSDVNTATASFDVVGFGTTIYSQDDSKAVLFNITPTTGVVRTEISPDDYSTLDGVNESGEAIGLGAYSPITGFAESYAPLVVTPPKTSLAVLQPACTVVRAGCGAVIDAPGITNTNCAFGGCMITADGTLLLVDLLTGSYELWFPNGTTQDVALDAGVASVPIINNSMQLLYTYDTVVSGVTLTKTALYDIPSGTALTVPPIPTSNCRSYTPISFNNQGEILGTALCVDSHNAYYDTYFFYNPATGTTDLSAQIPGRYYAIYPTGVNDAGDILVALQKANGGAYHWGFLRPSAAAYSKDASRGRVSPAGLPHLISRSEAAANSAARAQYYASFKTAAALSRTMQSTPLGSHRPAARFRSRPVHLPERGILASAPSYTIVDDGAPPLSKLVLKAPTAFNDTGQIVGMANDVPYTLHVACVVFDGTRFTDLRGSTPMTDCGPNSIGDENPATGAFGVVGDAVSAFSSDENPDIKAFLSQVTPKSGAVATTLFAANDESTLIGSNAAGSAVGGGFYDFRSFGTFGYPAFFVAAGSNSFRLLQPTCGPHAPCVSVSPARGQQCPFGGCEITANGSIFLDDQLIAPDGTIQVINLDVTAQSPTINNSNQILYLDGNHVQIYQIGTGAVTTIPAIPGSSCIALSPLSFNDAGQVLGVTDSCTKSTDYTYFVYDPKSGTKNLIAELPSGSASVTPVGINNNGQILVGLTLPSGIIHWGTLNPITAQTHSNTRLRRN